MKFKDFQAPDLFSSTFKALNLGEKKSSTFKVGWLSLTALSTQCRSYRAQVLSRMRGNPADIMVK